MGWVVNATSRPLYPGKETWYPLCSRQCGSHGRSGGTGKNSPKPGFEPRTVQSVASRKTDNGIPEWSSVRLMVMFSHEPSFERSKWEWIQLPNKKPHGRNTHYMPSALNGWLWIFTTAKTPEPTDQTIVTSLNRRKNGIWSGHMSDA
jgi:hypothetical protein